MSKGLEAYNYIFNTILMPDVDKETRQKIYCAMDDIEKELKALEIIKNKRVNVDLLIDCIYLYKGRALEYYNKKFNILNYDMRHLTQEEYELLKEVFYEMV